MNVCSVHLYVVQIPTAQMKREVTIAHVWMDSLQQTQVYPSVLITDVEVYFIFTFVFTLTMNDNPEFIHVIFVLVVIYVNQALSFSLFSFMYVSPKLFFFS